jgi:predicted ATPase
VADAKKAGLWGKTGPWSQYSKRMLQLRARGFALRDAFPDVLKGLVTAEEAQDYPTTPAAAQPVVVRPKFDTPAEERADPFEVAKAAIEAESDIGKLDAMRRKIDVRVKDGTFTSFQADELCDRIHARVEFLEAEREPAEAVSVNGHGYGR